MKSFLAVSYARDTLAMRGAPPRAEVVACLGDDARVLRSDGGWIAFHGEDPGDRIDDAGVAFTLLLGRAARTRTADVPASELAEQLRKGAKADGAALAELVPPFAAVDRSGPGEPIVAATDWLGFRQLFWWQGDGVAAVSTSALALGALAGAGLDHTALGLQSLVGWQVGFGTVFAQVEKVPAGCLAVLDAGRVETHRYVEQALALDGPAPSLPEVVDEMAGMLREFLRAYVADHPTTVLQLTGGQDTRVLLAALSPETRRGLRALTLDLRGGSDAALAEKLSAMCGLDLHVHWLDDQPPVTPAAAHHMALKAAAALDGMASPLALAPLLLAEGHLEQGHRLSGLGGETCRGFYYFGQPRHATTSPHLIGQLANWRLYANEAVDARALEPGFVASARTDALERITASFDGAPQQWLRATDYFYLYQRMQRWAGAHGSVAAVHRFFINPMFDRRFVQLAHSMSPDQKGNGLLTGQLIHRLDPELAAVPLDSGLVPARLGQRGIGDRATAARVTARKLSRKVRQRLRHSGRAQLGAAELAALVVEHWRTEPEVLAPLRNNGIVRAAWLDELIAGRRESAPATVAFLTNLLVATASRPVT
ncbi:asparagine synthetase B family protein [Micromonospora inositola]|uniref:Asparagine synthase (Glutamine-hydrolysing) n=1 Tax=Micromonospora inositola TaxID=47865 RepID=A0A1C5JEN3_9ACTN|nr:hypothetical protein [Micromonospora inositola]SCG68761.1 asparagine synthase (glutamine-hydrolysing) [Micromonospora inositola]